MSLLLVYSLFWLTYSEISVVYGNNVVSLFEEIEVCFGEISACLLTFIERFCFEACWSAYECFVNGC